MITGVLQKVELSLMSEVHFMIHQFQSDVQQDIKAVQHAFQTIHEQITSKLQQCVSQTDKFLTSLIELESELEKIFQSVKKESVDQQRVCIGITSSQHHCYSTPAIRTYSCDSSNCFNPFFNICG